MFVWKTSLSAQLPAGGDGKIGGTLSQANQTKGKLVRLGCMGLSGGEKRPANGFTCVRKNPDCCG